MAKETRYRLEQVQLLRVTAQGAVELALVGQDVASGNSFELDRLIMQ